MYLQQLVFKVIIMKKSFVCILTAVFLCFSFFTMVLADSDSKKIVENIIKGNQDYLVFASLGNKDASYFDVQVMDIIGEGDALTDQEKENLQRRFEKSISITGIDSYMYYGENDDKPRTGDNVLISINALNADTYVIKNGVFRVDSLSISQFKFEVPQTIEGTDEAKELQALYTYVYTDGKINDIEIKADGVYYKKADSNSYEKQAENVGIGFLDEFGDPTEGVDNKYPELQNADDGNSAESKWKLVAFILVLGLVMGAVVIRILKKIEKRYDIR